HEVESLSQVNANDDKFRIMPAAGPLAKTGDYPLVIVQCTFRAEAADDPKRFHLLTTNLLSLNLWYDTPRFLLFLWPTGTAKHSCIRTKNKKGERRAPPAQTPAMYRGLGNRDPAESVRRRKKP